jgi:hypothetical protein
MDSLRNYLLATPNSTNSRSSNGMNRSNNGVANLSQVAASQPARDDSSQVAASQPAKDGSSQAAGDDAITDRNSSSTDLQIVIQTNNLPKNFDFDTHVRYNYLNSKISSLLSL